MRAADQVDPEVAELAGAPAREPAHEGDGHGHTDRGGDEVLHGQTGHLHQVALGRLTRVGLPVGVGDEADGGVPRQRRGHRRGRVVEVQRQLALHQLEDEQEQDADRRERQHAAGVGAPGLFGFRVGADQPVDRRARRVSAFRSCTPGTCSRPAARARPPGRGSSSARKMIPAVVVLTRTSPGRAGRRRGTARGGSTAPGRRRFRSSQSLDQLLHQAEQGEDHHRQHDVHHYGHEFSHTYRPVGSRRTRTGSTPFRGLATVFMPS